MKYLLIALTAITLIGTPAAQAQNTQVASISGTNFKVAANAYQVGYYGIAMRRWLNLAEANNGSAQYNLGLMHYYGQGVSKNSVEAFKWFLLADGNGIEKGKIAVHRLTRMLNPLQISQAKKLVREWKATHDN